MRKKQNTSVPVKPSIHLVLTTEGFRGGSDARFKISELHGCPYIEVPNGDNPMIKASCGDKLKASDVAELNAKFPSVQISVVQDRADQEEQEYIRGRARMLRMYGYAYPF